MKSGAVEPPPPNRWLHESWAVAAERERELLGVVDRRYQVRIRDRLLHGVAEVQWCRVLENVNERVAATAATEREVPLRQLLDHLSSQLGFVGGHREVLERWLATPIASLPAWRVFGAVTFVVRRNAGEVFRLQRTAVWMAVANTLQQIAREDCGLEREGITREQFACLWYAGRHPRADLLVGRFQDGSDAVVKVVKEVLAYVRLRFPRVESPDFVRQTLGEWQRAYCLYAAHLVAAYEGVADVVFTP